MKSKDGDVNERRAAPVDVIGDYVSTVDRGHDDFLMIVSLRVWIIAADAV